MAQLKPDDYMKWTRSTWNNDGILQEVATLYLEDGSVDIQLIQVLNAACGMSGEAGEFLDRIKKLVFHGHPMDKTEHRKLINELGDIQYYLARCADILGFGLEGVMKYNQWKLNQRYPDGFSSDASIKRVDNV